MRKYYIIHTPYGDDYIVNEKGQITQYRYTEKENNSFANDWKILGIHHTKRNTFINWDTVMKLIDKEEAPEWLYKTTQNPQYTIVDLDHETTREWGNTKSHGIKYIQKLDNTLYKS